MASSLSFAVMAAALALTHNVAAAEAPASTITKAPTPSQILDARTIQVSTYTYETTSPLPLTDYFYPYDDIPYQVNPYAVGRGPQSGYNECNSTTEGADSQCQTAIMNSIEDFCFWGSATPNSTVGDVEAAVVAYCSKSGHGTRIFPEGTFSAVQFMRTDAYIQIVGYYNQTVTGLQADDSGGELDPHGADYLGNPLGGLFYSTGFTSGDNSTYLQTQSWNNFIGSGQFCLKLCDPGYDTTLNYCQNTYDLIGCDYNMPADYTTLSEGDIFISCEGDLQDEVGTYTSDGATYTWSQPVSLDATTTLPWTPRIPSSSNCVTYQSTDLFPAYDLGYQNTNSVSSPAAASTTASGSSASSSSSAKSSGSSAASRSGSTTVSATASASASVSASASSSAALNTITLSSTGFFATLVAAGLAAGVFFV